KNLIPDRVALTANLLCFRGCLGDKHGDFTIRAGADFLGTLCALSAELRGLALTFGLHALVDSLAVLLGKIRASDTHIHHLNAIRGSLAVNQFADARHEIGALIADHMGECYFAQHAAERRIEEN